MSDAMRGEIGVLYASAEHLDSALRTDLHQPGSGAADVCGSAASYAAAPAA